VKSEIATFFEVFPHGTIWGNHANGHGYDVVLLGLPEGATINVDDVQQRLDRPDHADVAQSLKEVGFDGFLSLFKSYAGRASDLAPWLAEAEINRDRNLRLQYLAGMGLNHKEGSFIYDQIVSNRKFPEGLFVGSKIRVAALRFVLTPHASDH
jgi:spermidine synthase